MEKVDLSSNLYDMNTYAGRAAHFYRSVNPMNLFKDTSGAKEIVDKVKANGGVIPGNWLILFLRKFLCTGGLEKLAREKLARHWKNWPSIGKIGQPLEKLARLFQPPCN